MAPGRGTRFLRPTSRYLAEFTLNPNQDRNRRSTGETSVKSLGRLITGATPLSLDGDLRFTDLRDICEAILKQQRKTRNRRFAAYDPFINVEDVCVIDALSRRLDAAIRKGPAVVDMLTTNIDDWDPIAEVLVRMPSGDWRKCLEFHVASIANPTTRVTETQRSSLHD